MIVRCGEDHKEYKAVQMRVNKSLGEIRDVISRVHRNYEVAHDAAEYIGERGYADGASSAAEEALDVYANGQHTLMHNFAIILQNATALMEHADSTSRMEE